MLETKTNFATSSKNLFIYLLDAKRILLCVSVFFALFSCTSEKKEVVEKSILLSGRRKAPLGWVYLTVYEDSSFQFALTGLRGGKIYNGTAAFKSDTIFFEYEDSIPKAGKIAVLSEFNISYIDGDYQENLGVTKNKLNNIAKK